MDQTLSSLSGRNVLLGVTGSVAAVKAPALVRQWQADGAHVQVLLTQGGRNFWDRAAAYENGTDYDDRGPRWLPPDVQIHDANDEWSVWNRMGDEVVHIALRDWADVLVVAPLSANTLAKLSHGLCDDTLSCVVRAWDFGHNRDNGSSGKPLVLAPAMNTTMWHHPLTRQQLEQIQSWHVQNGVVVVPPQAKLLACGDVGVGAMADLADISRAVQDVLQRQVEQPP